MKFLLKIDGLEVVNLNSKESGHLALRFKDTEALFKNFKENGIICDYEERYDVIRISFNALYTSFDDLYRAS